MRNGWARGEPLSAFVKVCPQKAHHSQYSHQPMLILDFKVDSVNLWSRAVVSKADRKVVRPKKPPPQLCRGSFSP